MDELRQVGKEGVEVGNVFRIRLCKVLKKRICDWELRKERGVRGEGRESPCMN